MTVPDFSIIISCTPEHRVNEVLQRYGFPAWSAPTGPADTRTLRPDHHPWKSSGRVDLLAVESSGRLAIIEIKLAGNTEARRAVVAQVLSYAAYLQGLTPDRLESEVLGLHLQKRGAASVVAVVEAADQQGVLDPLAFTAGLARSLADGGFRLVFVLDPKPGS